MQQDLPTNQPTHCGYIGILGQPNVGKSTLLNALVGERVSITTFKPQTTRHKILGIRTIANTQMIYVDTPGLFQKHKRENALHRHMKKTALSAIHDVDLLVFVVCALHWDAEDEWILDKLKAAHPPLILVINKVDKLRDKAQLLPFLKQLEKKADFLAMIPLSAIEGFNVGALEKEVINLMPPGPFLFPPGQCTDRDEKFLAAEIVREKSFYFLGDELPFGIDVQIEKFSRHKKNYSY